MDAKKFENARWRSGDQKRQFRHLTCVDLIDGGSVLDVGCGDGLLLSMLREKGVTGEGVDFSDEAIKKCTEKNIKATQHDLSERFPFADGSFDCVVALDVLEHQFNPLAVLREMARVSRKNVIVGVPNFSSLPARLQALFGVVPENNKPNKGHVYWFNYHVLKNLANQSGLSIKAYRANTFRPLSFFGNFFQNAFPNSCALSFVVHFVKKT